MYSVKSYFLKTNKFCKLKCTLLKFRNYKHYLNVKFETDSLLTVRALQRAVHNQLEIGCAVEFIIGWKQDICFKTVWFGSKQMRVFQYRLF